MEQSTFNGTVHMPLPWHGSRSFTFVMLKYININLHSYAPPLPFIFITIRSFSFDQDGQFLRRLTGEQPTAAPI